MAAAAPVRPKSPSLDEMDAEARAARQVHGHSVQLSRFVSLEDSVARQEHEAQEGIDRMLQRIRRCALDKTEYRTAVKYFSEQSKAGNVQASLCAANLLLLGCAPDYKPEPEKAWRWLTQAIMRNHAQSQLFVSDAYLWGRYGKIQSPLLAHILIEDLLAKGYVSAVAQAQAIRKILPLEREAGCIVCEKQEAVDGGALKLCAGCRRVRYCCKEHQVQHWKSGHKAECAEVNEWLSHFAKRAELNAAREAKIRAAKAPIHIEVVEDGPSPKQQPPPSAAAPTSSAPA
jgi:TPR repeat protein